MILCKNTSAMFRSLDGDSVFFDIFAAVLQEDRLILFLFIIYLHHGLRISIVLMK